MWCIVGIWPNGFPGAEKRPNICWRHLWRWHFWKRVTAAHRWITATRAIGLLSTRRSTATCATMPPSSSCSCWPTCLAHSKSAGGIVRRQSSRHQQTPEKHLRVGRIIARGNYLQNRNSSIGHFIESWPTEPAAPMKCGMKCAMKACRRQVPNSCHTRFIPPCRPWQFGQPVPRTFQRPVWCHKCDTRAGGGARLRTNRLAGTLAPAVADVLRVALRAHLRSD